MADIAERLQTPPEAPGQLSPADREAISAYLAPRLDRLEAGLGAAACGYVLHGDSGSVLAAISSLRGVPYLHNTLSYLLGYESKPDVRRVFLEAQSWNPAVVRRLGEVLVAAARCGGYARRWPGTASSPDHLRALVHVSVLLLQQHAVHSASWLLSAPRCLELLSSDGGDQAQLVDVLFATTDRNYYRLGRRRLLSMGGLAQVLAAAPVRALHGARGLDQQGRCGFVSFLGETELPACPQFTEYLFDTMANAASLQSEAALCALAACDRELLMAGAARCLASDVPARRLAATRLLLQIATRPAQALLAQHRAVEKVVKLRKVMRQALWELNVLLEDGERSGADGAQGYLAMDGRWIAIPPVPPLPASQGLPAGWAEGLRAAVAQASRETGRGGSGPYNAAAVGQLVDALNDGVLPEDIRHLRCLTGSGVVAGPAAVIQRYRSRLRKLLSQPQVTPQHLARALALDQVEAEAGTATASIGLYRWPYLLVRSGSTSIPALLLREHALRLGDWRTVLIATESLGSSAEVIDELLGTEPERWAGVFREAQGPLLWPLVAEHLAMLDRVLRIAPGPQRWRAQRVSALVLLSFLPAPPRRYLPVLIDLALRGLREERPLARGLLSGAPGVQQRLVVLLKAKGRNTRRAAAAWLGERGERASIPCLRAALEVEGIDAVRDSLLSALVVLGDDLSDLTGEERLLEEARSGLARIGCEVQRCVPLNSLPQLNWADGRPVPGDVVRWLIVLADVLEQPRGTAFLDLLVERLDGPSAEHLGQLVLACFVSFGRRSDKPASACAAPEAGRPVQALRPEVLAGKQSKRQKKLVHNGQMHRGILALTQRVQPSTVVSVVDAYLREHPQRTPQCRALLDTLAHHGSALALQLLLSISSRYGRRHQRQHAEALLDGVAQQHGWSWQELIDRTIPTCGLAQGGTLAVGSGPGAYTVRLDAGLQLVLCNPQGRIVRSLPAASAGRKALAELKKQLKETIAKQTVRLYEAMCVERQWRADELEFLLRHPVAGRLCEGLIFAGLGTQGERLAVFRPLGDGTLSDAADCSVDLSQLTAIRLAHRVMLDETQVTAWQQHLQDYRIMPLFEQLGRPLLRVDEELGWEYSITDRKGYMLDTQTLRAQAIRRGYQRAKVSDTHRFTHYEKSFAAAGLTAIIDFTGSPVQEPHALCALLGLRVADRHRYEAEESLPLSSVPAVLLSEVWNDVRDIAAAGSGFDPKWRTRVF